MRPDKIINESRVFDPHAFFYSRTDKRGVIRSGNDVFFDISGYPPDALIGAPHKVLRHPDMPRGVFHLLWATIQSGAPMGAIVKNLAQDGRYYWVFATILPLDDGYISVRMGTQGPLFDKTQEIYARMLQAEAGGLDAAGSAKLLLDELAALGYEEYQDYLADLLMRHLGDTQQNSAEVSRLGALYDAMVSVTEARASLIETLRTLYLIPTNMRILASRLEPSGGPVSAISDSYKRAAAELMARLSGTDRAERSGRSENATAAISRALVPTATASLLNLAATQFERARPAPGVDPAQERALIARLVAKLESVSVESKERMMQTVTHISREAEHIKRLMAGLEQIRILGEVESGRLRNSDGGLAAVMAQLTTFHAQIHTRLATMSNVAARMQSGIA